MLSRMVDEYNLRIYSKTWIQRPLKGSNGGGLLQQVVFKCRLNAGSIRLIQEGLLYQNIGLYGQVVS